MADRARPPSRNGVELAAYRAAGHPGFHGPGTHSQPGNPGSRTVGATAGGDRPSDRERTPGARHRSARIDHRQLAGQGGQLTQVEADLARAQEEAARERQGAELARTELAKALLRLEAMPRLEGDLEAIRGTLEVEKNARANAEKQAAVAVEKAIGIEARLTDLQSKAANENQARVEAEKQAATMARELADARVAVQAAQLPLEAAARDIADLKKAVADARATAKAAGEEAAALRGRLEAQPKS